MTSKTVIAIIAGGKSSRMGEDKTALLWRGKTLLSHVASEAFSTGLPVVIVGQKKPDDWQYPDIIFIDDTISGQGPIAGIDAALNHSNRANVLALASDMPLLDNLSIQWLLDQIEEFEVEHGMIVRSKNGMEPLFSVYSPSVSDLVSQCMSNGVRSLQKMIAQGNFKIVDAPDHIERALVNVNTPDDWQKITSVI